jgi:nitrate reductase assembly molybdenum cofactor insertion protein NarJ
MLNKKLGGFKNMVGNGQIKSDEIVKPKVLMQQEEENKSDFIDDDFDFVIGRVISKFLLVLFDYPTEEKVEKAKTMAEFLRAHKDILPDYIVELADEVSNLRFSENLQADYVSIFDFQTPPFISFCAQAENPNLILILDSIYTSEGVYVDETKLPDEFSTIFEFLSLLYSRKRKDKIKYMSVILKPALRFPEPDHQLYVKVVKSMKSFVQNFLFEKGGEF